jgi:hypothetical protein
MKPAPYAHAETLGPDSTAIIRLARVRWLGLTLAQRAALRRVNSGFVRPRLDSGTNLRTIRAMRAHGFISPVDTDLTPLGLLVRESGLAHDAELAGPRKKARDHGSENVEAR